MHSTYGSNELIADFIDKETWSASGTDIKGDAYESLLAKGAEDIKSGAGQYFTPRPLIQAMVDCVRPTASDTVIDPAAGTGGFLLAAHEYAAAQAEDLTPDERDHLRDGLVHGVELVDGAARLAAMNLILHGIAGRASTASARSSGPDLPTAPGEPTASCANSEDRVRVDVALLRTNARETVNADAIVENRSSSEGAAGLKGCGARRERGVNFPQ